jgi:hypothetical protein
MNPHDVLVVVAGELRSADTLAVFRYGLEAVPRVYMPYKEKHKAPKGFGSLCPRMPEDVPSELLASAISVADVGENKLWAARGEWLFCAHPSPGEDAWHGFPVIGGDADERVLEALEGAGMISSRERRRLRRQRTLPGEWP